MFQFGLEVQLRFRYDDIGIIWDFLRTMCVVYAAIIVTIVYIVLVVVVVVFVVRQHMV